MSFSDFALDDRLLSAVTTAGYDQPTDIQRQAIPLLLEGRDLLASAPTGTGKTGAFALPALQRLTRPIKSQRGSPRILVLAPTRELATQVNAAFQKYRGKIRAFTGTVVGGESYFRQERLLSGPVDVLVATPGRLIDHLDRNQVRLDNVELLVLDEADRMLDLGFSEAVDRIVSETPKDRQTVLFSATFAGHVQSLAQRLLRNPERVAISDMQVRHPDITDKIFVADDHSHKHALLDRILSEEDLAQAIIFTATKRGADELAQRLYDEGHSCVALHGDMRQGARNRVIERMRRGNVRLLVATDVAARGLDVRDISHVINFDLPMVPEDYIHRIGRTGRAGASGVAISFVGPGDWKKLAGIERLTGQRINRETLPGLEPKRRERTPFGRRPQGKPGGGAGVQNRGGRRPFGNDQRSTERNAYGRKRSRYATR